MFGLGFGEILVILVIALLVFGPDKLPDIARTLGRSVAELRRSMEDLRHELTMPQLDLNTKPEAQAPEIKPVIQTPSLEGTCEEKRIDAAEPISAVPPESNPEVRLPEDFSAAAEAATETVPQHIEPRKDQEQH